MILRDLILFFCVVIEHNIDQSHRAVTHTVQVAALQVVMGLAWHQLHSFILADRPTLEATHQRQE